MSKEKAVAKLSGELNFILTIRDDLTGRFKVKSSPIYENDRDNGSHMFLTIEEAENY